MNLCDEDGELIGAYDYDVFGNVREQDGAETEFSFAGEQSDPNGLDFLRARYYDPEIGRFLGTDPAGQGSNYYAYGLNNPVNLKDPSGLWTTCNHWRSVSTGDGWETYCMIPKETDTAYSNQAVLDEKGNWVAPFQIEIWEEGDRLCGPNGGYGTTCVSQNQSRVGKEWRGGKELETVVDSWSVVTLNPTGSLTLEVCEDVWHNQGPSAFGMSGCDAWTNDGPDWSLFDPTKVLSGISAGIACGWLAASSTGNPYATVGATVICTGAGYYIEGFEVPQ